MIKTLINRVLIVISAFLNNKRMRADNKKILIVFSQIYGDAILFSKAINNYTELYKKEDGYSLTLLLRPNIHLFLDELFEIDKDINIEDVDFARFLNDYKYYKRCVSKYKGYFSTLIVPVTTLSAEVFAKSSDAKRKVGLLRANYMRKPLYRAYFNRRAYTETVQPGKEDMVLQCHAQLLNYLCDEEKTYHAELPQARTVEKIVGDEHYCVMAIGSSMPEKQWPADRFAEVANYIIEKYGIKVHLCGTQEDKVIEEVFFMYISDKENVISHIGLTSYKEWLSLIQYADFVIGNDSASAHLAGAVGKTAIVIVGVHEKNRFFPYTIDTDKSDEILPITIMHDMPCAWCKTKYYKFGKGNKKCRDVILKENCAECISVISVTEVETKIDEVIGEH